MNISVIGLGKLGLCTAACFASKGHNVIGVDTNQSTLSELKAKRSPICETGIDDLLMKAWPTFSVTDSIRSAVLGSDITLIVVPTNSNPEGDFNSEHIEAVLESLAPALYEKETFHVVDIVSTIMPGSCDRRFRPMLEKLSGLEFGNDFGLVYNPEFIALGSVINNFLNPDMVLIGASDKRSGEIAASLYRSSCDNDAPIVVMSLVNAEITKLSINCYVTSKISFANELAAICEKFPGADIDEVSFAMGKDSRIGAKYLKGGLGFGGPCFPRDNLAFQYFAKEAGYKPLIGPQVVAVNHAVVKRLKNIVSENTPKGGKLAFLGISYKPETQIIEESQSLMLAEDLAGMGYECILSDPRCLSNAEKALADKVKCESDPYKAVEKAEAILLLTNWPEYEKLDWRCIADSAAPDALLIDSWRILKNNRPGGLRYFGIGMGFET